MPGDNFHVEVRSSDREHFNAAVRMAFSAHTNATHYVCDLPERRCLECSEGRCESWEPCHASVPHKDRKSVIHACPACEGTGRFPPRTAMILLWHESAMHTVRATKLPFSLNEDSASDFLWAWLQSTPYPPQPDQDGSNKKGFIVTTGDFWGHIEGCHYTILAVYPDWQMYGK